MPGLSFPILALIASAILFAPLASWLALQRARSWALWFLFGVALGPIASLLLVLGPPGRCPACATPSVGWPRSCTNCGLIFGSPEAQLGGPSTANGEAAAADSRSVPHRSGAPGGSAAAQSPAVPAATIGYPPPIAGFEPAHRPATALGRRATHEEPHPAEPEPIGAPNSTVPGPIPAVTDGPAAEPESRRTATGTLSMLGSGVFIGGSEPLQVGSRYLLARAGAELHVLGPVHISPAAVAARIPLAGVEPTLLADRLLITSSRPGRGTDLAFGGVSLERGVDVTRELRPPRKGRSVP